jgi:glucose/arabinose dehydrogenase
VLSRVAVVPRLASRDSARRRAAHRWARLVLLLAALLATSLAGCASFPDIGPRNWHDKPRDNGPLAAQPNVPSPGPDAGHPDQSPPGQPSQQPTPKGCTDPDPLVVATCLNPVSAIAVLPDGQSALAAERSTGRIMLVQKGKDPRLFTIVPVDASSGGLSGLVLSPSYEDDQLVYAYAATPTDNRVLRIAKGYPPVPILSGIPRTEGSDAGALGVGRDGALLIATGSDSPNPGASSLAGKLLRIDTFGHPFKDNPNPSSPIYSSGLLSPSGVCIAPGTGIAWVTDRLPDHDALYRIIPGRLGNPAWNWPDRPGVAGCVATGGNIAVAERGASSLFVLQTLPKTDSFTGTPATSLVNKYGRLSGATLGPGGLVWLGTANKGAGGPVAASDDRVIRLPLIPGGNGGSGPD